MPGSLYTTSVLSGSIDRLIKRPTMTLRRKIVSLTLCLLLLFMATAAVSLLLQSKINEQFSGVVDDYLPLNAAVATIDVFTDRYELNLLRHR